MPHRRLIAFDGREVVGQVGLDVRAIRVGDDVVGTCGLIDLCVRSDSRGRGTASALIREAEAVARRSGLPFLTLMADRHDLYERHGFSRVHPAVTTWLGIENRRSIGLIERDLSDCFMAKALTSRPWPAGSIDMLG